MASELQVNTITEATSGSGITFAKDIIPATPLSHRNMVINGGMKVNQRKIANLAQGTSNQYTVDRFVTLVTESFDFDTTINRIDLSGSDIATTGQTSALKIEADSTQTPSGSANAGIATQLEGQDVQRLLYGTSAARDSVLTFWAKGSTNSVGTYACQISYIDSSSNWYSQYHTFSLTTSWTKYTINVGGNGTSTSSGPVNSNAMGFNITWWLACGPDDLVSATSTWVSNPSPTYQGVTGMSNFLDDASNEFYLTGVQFELGTVATPFEHRSIAEELDRCQRYYQKSYSLDVAPGTSGANDGAISTRYYAAVVNLYDASARFNKSMRTQPTMKIYDTQGNADVVSRYGAGTSHAANRTVSSIYHRGENGFGGFTMSSGTTNTIVFHYTAEAEL